MAPRGMYSPKWASSLLSTTPIMVNLNADLLADGYPYGDGGKTGITLVDAGHREEIGRIKAGRLDRYAGIGRQRRAGVIDGRIENAIRTIGQGIAINQCVVGMCL